MFYPNHHIRSYCKYLGSLELDGHKYDLGVYEHDGSASHAIVYGEESSKYLSGDLYLGYEGPLGLVAIINKMVYLNQRRL